MSEPGLTNPWEPWQRLIDSIGPDYRRRLYKARARARPRLNDLDEHELASIASAGRGIAGALDEEGARLTVSLTDDRERQSRLASELQAESERIARETQWTRAIERLNDAAAETG